MNIETALEDYKNKNKAINYIIDQLDTERIRKVMKYLDWHWANYEGIPDDFEIRQEARKLLEQLVFEDYNFLETGGFRAERLKDGDEEYYSLNFIIDSCDSYTISVLNEKQKHKQN